MTHRRTVALIVAAGQGNRAQMDRPKQFAPLGGKALLCWSVDIFNSSTAIDAVYIVIGKGQETLLTQTLGTRVVSGIITGGAERSQSVRAGLEFIAAQDGAEYVLIHDAARPFLSHTTIQRLCVALETHQGACPTLASLDTLALSEHGLLGNTIDRSTIVRVQTPQAFHFHAILAAHQRYGDATATDDAQIARAAGVKIVQVEGDVALEKITHAADFAHAESRLAARETRTAMGYDVHRLEVGETLWLCGVKVPHTHGLAGHSDADVGLHALTDALLGTIAAGDIGTHFPPSDPQWRGAASPLFVRHAAHLIQKAGGIIGHVDITLICEQPKIAPHRQAMRAAIADMLQLELTRVSVKATTTEGLGFTGRREGIAAHAVASIKI